MRVRDVMTTDVVTVSPDTPIREVATLLSERRFSGLPVVDADGAVVGVVSEADILYKEREREEGHEGLLGRVLHRGPGESTEAKLAATTAGEAMTSPAVLTRPGVLVSAVASLMLDHKINRLPVVDDGKLSGPIESGRLVGIISRGDLVRAFARSAEEVRKEIEELVTYQTGLWNLHPDAISFTFTDGEVTLDGTVDVPNQAESLAADVARITGVVSVRSNLAWRYGEGE